jgi:hypothetical protein
VDDKLFPVVIPATVGLVGIVVSSVFSVLNYLQSRSKAKADRNSRRREAIITALTEFYGPLLYYIDVTRALYAPFRANKPQEFRTLTHLLDPEQTYEVDGQRRRVVLSDSDRSLLNRIIEAEDKIEELIRLKGGLVDDPVLLSDYAPDPARTDIDKERIQKMGLLGLAITHFRVLKMANAGEIKGEIEKYKHLVYPRELDYYVKDKVKALQADLAKLTDRS